MNYEEIEYAIAYLRRDMADMTEVMSSLKVEIARLADAIEAIMKNSSGQQEDND